ncbi:MULTISPECIES: hypothetical protein [Leisingera]|uniref:hypothetical protein n=1 Tax=Leisingera TaxID=191028 RepID=UPI000AD3B178|nr:hypothetical protein [Leisingera aquimarina]
MRGFQTLAGAKAALAGIATFRAIRKGQFENCETGVINEIVFVAIRTASALLEVTFRCELDYRAGNRGPALGL